jgi:hypothetical protein
VLVVIFADAEDVLGHPGTGANRSGETCLLRYLFLDATGGTTMSAVRPLFI